MKRTLFIGLSLAAALLASSGCDKPAQGGKSAETRGRHAAEATTAHDDHDHDHVHKAPHGGVLVELGEHVASVEIVFDADAGRLSLYSLDGCAENAVRIKQEAISVHVSAAGKSNPRQFSLVARENALTGEKAGDSAEFGAQDVGLKGLTAIEGTIVKIEIKGQSYSDVKFAWPRSGG